MSSSTVTTLLLAALFSIGALSSAIAGQSRDVRPLPDSPGRIRPLRVARARLAPLPEATWTDAQRRLAAKSAPAGRAGNALGTLLRMPDLAEAIVAIDTYYSRNSTLSARHRELLVLRTSWLLNSEYLWSEHVPRARAANLTAGDVRRVALGASARGWQPFEATLLRMADQLFRNASVNDDVYQALTAEYDLRQTMDAVMLVGSFTTLGLLYNALGVQPDSWNHDRIPTDVPYQVVVPAREPPLAVARIAPGPGTGLAVSRTFDRHPGLAEPRKAANYANRQSTLSPRYREMMILRTGWDCQSEYEWAQHVGTVGRAREMGIPVENIAHGPAAPGWSPIERALLQAADELYRDSGISDSTWASLSDGLPPEMVVNAIMSAATYRQVSMALNTFGVQLEPGDERFPTMATLGAARPAEALNADYWRGGWRTPLGEAPHIYYFVIRGDRVTGVYCRNCSDATTIGFIDGSWNEKTGIAFTVTVPNADGSIKSADKQRAMLADGRLTVTGGRAGRNGQGLTLIKDPRRPDPGGQPAYYLPPGTPTVYPDARRGSGGAPAPRAPYWPAGPFKALRPADIVGTWIAASFGPLGMNKQIFTFLRVGDRLRGVVCGRCDNAYTLAALEHVSIVGDRLYFHIAHQDRGNIDPPIFDRTILAQIVQNEMIASILGNDITIPPANPPARPAGLPFTLVGPIGADATRGNSSEGIDVWGPGTGAAVQPPPATAPSAGR